MHVVITGANRGIGKALAEVARARGDTVTGTARRPTGDLLPLDVTDPASARALAEHLSGRPIDLLVCNAGVYPDKGQRLEDGYGPEIWAEAFAVNVTGVFLTVQALLPNLQRAAGRIAILSSIMASDSLAPGGSYAYRASKAAALNLGRNLAVDLAPRGIAVGIYHPGWVRTEMGGPAAEIDPADAARGLLARFDALGPDTSGCFEDYTGRPIPF